MKAAPLSDSNILQGLLDELKSQTPEETSYADALDPSKPDAISVTPQDNSFQKTTNSAVKLSDQNIYYSPPPALPVQKPLIDWPRFLLFSTSVFLVFKILKRRK